MSKDIYKDLSAPFPKEAMQKDSSRGFDLTSIKAQYVRERLNEVMGVDGWETKSHVVSQDDKGVAVALEMTLHFPKGRSVTRSAYGGCVIKAKGQTYGDRYKSAETDALSKAASNFGVGNDVFKGLVNAKTLTLTGSSSSSSSSSPKPPTKSASASKPSFRKPTTTEDVPVVEEDDGDDI